MSQEADSTNTELAKAGIAQAAAEGQTQVATPTESATAGAAKTGPENPFSSEDAELQALQEEQTKAEAIAAGKAPEKAATAADEPGQSKESGTAAAKPAAQHDPKDSAIVALRRKNQELTGALLVKEGENRVLKTLVDPTKFAGEAGAEGGTGQVQPSPEEQELAELDAERLRIAEEVDGGRMTMVEHNAILNKIAAAERTITLAQTQAMVQASAQPVNDLGLQEHVGTLLTKYPVLNTMTAAQLAPFEQIAYEQAEAEGKPIQPGPIGTRDLRERMGALATRIYGQPAGAAGAGGTGAAATGSTMVTQPTAAQREAKLTLAASLPANIGATGSGATGGEPTDAQATAALFNTDEDAAIRWLESHPGYTQKQAGNSFRLRR